LLKRLNRKGVIKMTEKKKACGCGCVILPKKTSEKQNKGKKSQVGR
jgi:hypothetical protein